MSNNDKSSKYWLSLSENIEAPLETLNKRDNMSIYDVEFVKKYIKKTDKLLDIGSGSGLVVNKISPLVTYTLAVETFEGLTKFINREHNVDVLNVKLEEFKTDKTFDISVMTGVSQFFTQKLIEGIYSTIFNSLKKGSKFLIRAHCGIEKDVEVNGYSEELECDYFAEYRQIDKEVGILRKIGFKEVTYTDELPDTINVWDNTRHYYIVCTK